MQDPETKPDTTAELAPIPKLGRLPRKGDARDLLFATYFAPVAVPKSYRPFRHRKPFPRQMFGNDGYGDCTKAKQAIAMLRLERIEQRRTISIADAEVVRVYLAMTERLYGGGDTGAYETDALSEWRRPELTFKDTKGRAMTIDAYTRVNVADADEVRAALYTSHAVGLAVCANMPKAWQGQSTWDAPADRADFVGPWTPGSWGGHSMWVSPNDDGWLYNEDGLYIQTWTNAPRLITWAGFAAFFDEAHNVVDSIDSWKRRLAKRMNAKKLVADVNAVSTLKIAA
jgi:hypothetical protein